MVRGHPAVQLVPGNSSYNNIYYDEYSYFHSFQHFEVYLVHLMHIIIVCDIRAFLKQQIRPAALRAGASCGEMILNRIRFVCDNGIDFPS